jgi:hypothetical protein
MPPAVLLARPRDGAAAVDLDEIVHAVDPRLVGVAIHAPHLAALWIGEEQIVRVLQPVQLLNEDG